MRRPRYPADHLSRASAELELRALPERPSISVLMPTYETPRRYLRAAIESVRAQHYPHWELCIVDDGSRSAAARRTIECYAARDDRITAKFLSRNCGISHASNEAVALSHGQLVAFLDHDDLLTPDALLRVARSFSRDEIDVVYSDQDKITPRGRRADPFFKPDWSPTYALGAMYIGHLLVVRRALVVEVGGFDPTFDTIQDFEFLLRLSEHTERIHHIQRILYHWRAIPGSIAAGALEKQGVPELQARAVAAHMRRLGISARAVPHRSIPHRVRLLPERRSTTPRVSVVVPAPSRGEQLDRCLDALERTSYPDLEVFIVRERGSVVAEALGHRGDMQLVDAGGHFHPAKMGNLGAERATGEYVVFLAESTEVIDRDWVEQLLVYAEMPGIGAVGPMLAHPDGRVAAAGFAIGLHDPTVPVMRGFPAGGDGYYGSLACAREVSALSRECLMIRRARFRELGGFKQAYSRQYEDFDLCLELRRRGLAAVCAPAPRTISHRTEASLRMDFDVLDRALFVDNNYDELQAGDPYFNANLSRGAADYTVDHDRDDPAPIADREVVG